jgi:hypothetical protein
VGNPSQLGNINILGKASQLGNPSQMDNTQIGNASKKYVGFHVTFLGRVFAFKKDHSGKVYGFYVIYSPLRIDEPYCCEQVEL